MRRGFLTIATFVSALFFPWPFTAMLALGVAFVEPYVPLAVGLFADILSYTTTTAPFPFFTLWGLVATVIAILVRSQLLTSTIGE